MRAREGAEEPGVLVGAIVDFDDVVERGLEEGELPEDHCEERERRSGRQRDQPCRRPHAAAPGAAAPQPPFFPELGKDKKGLTDSPGRWEPFIYPQSRYNRSSNQPPPCSLASTL